MCRFLGSIAPILAVGGLIAIGGAGYRVINGECPMCSHSQDSTKLVSTTTDDGHCPLCPGAGSDSGAALQTVSATAQPEEDGCCAGKANKTCTETKTVDGDEPPCCRHAPADTTAGAVKKDEKVAASGK